MSSLTGPVLVEYQDLFSSSSTAGGPGGGLNLGASASTGDGRIFAFSLAGGTALVPGKLQQNVVEVTGNEIIAVAAAAAIGATSVTVTLGATVTANQYAQGYLQVVVTPGQGYSYKIKSHPAANNAASCVITLEDPILVALTTASKVSLVPNPFSNIIVCPTTLTGIPVGVAIYPIASAQYGWIQTTGIAAVLSAGGTAVGQSVVPSTTVAGAVKTSTGTLPILGFAAQALTDTDYGPVFLAL